MDNILPNACIHVCTRVQPCIHIHYHAWHNIKSLGVCVSTHDDKHTVYIYLKCKWTVSDSCVLYKDVLIVIQVYIFYTCITSNKPLIYF